MHKCRIKSFGLALAAVLAASVAVNAQGPGNGPGFGPGFGAHRPPMERALGPGGNHGQWWNDPRVADKLKLTDDQRKGMDQILLQHRETLIDMRANVDKAELGMEPLMKDDQPNEARILAQIDKVAQARAELEKANARFLLALRGKLTPDQWKQLQAFRNERMGDWRRDGRGGDGQGRDRRGPDGQGQHRRMPQGGPQNGPQSAPQGAPPPPPAGSGADTEGMF